MRRMLFILAAVAVTAAITAPAAFADSPHFIKAGATTSGPNLVCTFKEAGLGTTVSTEAVTCSANATAVYECVNNGGNHPSAANKTTVSGPVSGGGTFPVRNGSTSGSITVGPPGPGGFGCPSGQTLVLASVCYSDVTLTGSAGDTANVPGTVCYTNPAAP